VATKLIIGGNFILSGRGNNQRQLILAGSSSEIVNLPKKEPNKKVQIIVLGEYTIFVSCSKSGNMKIGLIGYGKMGKEIEKIALKRGHTISLKVDVNNPEDLTVENLRKCDVAIEFTFPGSAVKNYLTCFEAGVPVVSGTTGWLAQRELVHRKCLDSGGTFFYASNFSLGVNLFFELNRILAGMMKDHPDYQVGIREIHHVQKLDAPSGTAITLAEDLVNLLPGKTGWKNESETEAGEIPVVSERTGTVPGTHIIKWDSDVDSIEIMHCAKSREGLALGAVLAAEFCRDHRGILTMKDMLKI